MKTIKIEAEENNLLTLVVVEHQLDCDDCIVQPPTLGVHRDVLVHRIHLLLRF
jgi:hypothetical protein